MPRLADYQPDRPWVARYPAGVRPHLEYPQQPVSWLLEQAVQHGPGVVACRYFNQEVTYEQLLTLSHRMAAALHSYGLQPGERVAILLPNIPEYLVALFGTWLASGTVVPLNPLMVREEIEALLDSTQCKVVIALDLLLPLVERHATEHAEKVIVTSLKDRLPWLSRQLYRLARLRRLGLRAYPANVVQYEAALTLAGNSADFPRPSPDESALILPTGGTTGRPKAVVLTHRNLVSNAWQLFHWTGQTTGQEVFLACLPFFHSYGLTACALTGVAMNATLVMHHRFRAETVLKLIERWRPTMIPAVPAMLAAFNRVLRKRHFNISGVKACISGGAPLDPKVAAEFSQHTGAVVVEGYGLSEASPVTHAGPLDGTARPGTIGLPLPDTDAAIVDAETGTEILPPGQVGELIVRGPQIMAGYWNNLEATASAIRDGWLFTGDLAMQDAEGFFKIVDRKKDLIITSGYNVYPTDVEHVLSRFEGIEDVAVLGVPDPVRGELVKAVVVAKAGSRFNRRAFYHFAEEHLEVHKRPRIVEVVAGPLPRNPLGKILRRVLREQHAQNAVSQAGAA
jgi:long-chain acyl-CoA synthetase